MPRIEFELPLYSRYNCEEMETRIEAQRQQTDQQRQEMETQLDAQRQQTEQQR